MCDSSEKPKNGWRGWSDVPLPRPQQSTADWVDLSHVLTEDLSRSTAFPKPIFRKLLKMPEASANITEVHMVVHHGTHVDAPSHFIADGPTFDQIPLHRLHGTAVVWRIDTPALAVIEAADFEKARPQVQPGDMVLLDTGWSAYINTERYEEHPHLNEEAAEWLVAHGVKLLGVDFSTPDLTAHHRPPGFTWPVHQILLRRGVLIAEHVANLAELAGHRVEAFFLAPNIHGADGSPTRAIARRID
jgi:arylformamidase